MRRRIAAKCVRDFGSFGITETYVKRAHHGASPSTLAADGNACDAARVE
jgi:hypothetical protein